jgi:hypothetical protein
MTNEAAAFADASPLIQLWSCECEAGQSCDFNNPHGDLESCPAGSVSKLELGGYEIWTRLEPKRWQEKIESIRKKKAESGAYLFLKRSAPRRTSLLMPAQFRAIIDPECPASNHLYYRCAANAYRWADREGCIQDLPEECSSEAWLEG